MTTMHHQPRAMLCIGSTHIMAALVVVAVIAMVSSTPLVHVAEGLEAAYVGSVGALSGVSGLSGDNTVASPALALNAAQYTNPNAIVGGNSTNIVYVADQQTVRELNIAANTARVVAGQRARVGNANGAATTVALFGAPTGLAHNNGIVYIADGPNHNIRMLKDGVISKIAGSGTAGNSNGAALAASFNNPGALIVDRTNPDKIYVVENVNNAIRLLNLATNTVSTVLTVNRPRSLAMSADGEFIAVGYIDLTTGTDSLMMYFPTNATQRILRTALAAPPRGLAVDGLKNIIFTQFSFVALLEAKTAYSYVVVAAGSGRANGEYPSQSPSFSGMSELCITSDYNYAFAEGPTNFDIRTITIYPRNTIVPWFVNVTALSAPTGNMTIMSALYVAALADFIGIIKYDISVTSGSPYIGATDANGTILQFNAPVFLNNISSRAAINASNFTLSKAVTAWFVDPKTLKIHFPSATVPSNNATAVTQLQAALLVDMVAMLGSSEGVSIKSTFTQNEGTLANEVAYYVDVPAYFHNDTTNANLKTYAFSKYNTALTTFNADRPLSLEFDASQFNFPFNNASVMSEIRALINAELATLTGVSASSFNITSFTTKTVVVGGVSKVIVVVNGTIPGTIENATTTAALQGATYPTLVAYLADFHAPKPITLGFPSYLIPVGSEAKMAAIQAAFLKDLFAIFNSSNPNVTAPSFLTNASNGASPFADIQSGNMVGLRAFIPGWFYNATSQGAFASASWTTLYALLNTTSNSTVSFGLDPVIQAANSGEQIPMNVSLTEARRMWATGVEPAKLATTKAMIELDLKNYYGYPVTITNLKIVPGTTYVTNSIPPTSLVGASWVNWTVQFPFSTDGISKPLSLAPFPNLFAYLAALITVPPSREVISRGVAPEATFFGDSCTIGCVIGVAIAIAAVIAVIIVVVVLVVARRKRKANVVAPSFNPMAKNPMQIGEEGGTDDVEMA